MINLEACISPYLEEKLKELWSRLGFASSINITTHQRTLPKHGIVAWNMASIQIPEHEYSLLKLCLPELNWKVIDDRSNG